jgi:hypothetical protein
MNIDIQNKADSRSLNDWCVTAPLTTLPVETVNEVRIDSLNYRDEMRIRTERSEYTFLLTDTPLLRGLLTGGQMGEEIVEADIIAVMDDDDIRLLNDFSTIGRGMRIMFSVADREMRITTSHIAMIILIRNQ